MKQSKNTFILLTSAADLNNTWFLHSISSPWKQRAQSCTCCDINCIEHIHNAPNVLIWLNISQQQSVTVLGVFSFGRYHNYFPCCVSTLSDSNSTRHADVKPATFWYWPHKDVVVLTWFALGLHIVNYAIYQRVFWGAVLLKVCLWLQPTLSYRGSIAPSLQNVL